MKAHIYQNSLEWREKTHYFYTWSLPKLEVKILNGGKWQIFLRKFRNRRGSHKYLQTASTCLSTHLMEIWKEKHRAHFLLFFDSLFFWGHFWLFTMCARIMRVCRSLWSQEPVCVSLHVTEHNHVNYRKIVAIILKQHFPHFQPPDFNTDGWQEELASSVVVPCCSTSWSCFFNIWHDEALQCLQSRVLACRYTHHD